MKKIKIADGLHELSAYANYEGEPLAIIDGQRLEVGWGVFYKPKSDKEFDFQIESHRFDPIKVMVKNEKKLITVSTIDGRLIFNAGVVYYPSFLNEFYEGNLGGPQVTVNGIKEVLEWIKRQGGKDFYIQSFITGDNHVYHASSKIKKYHMDQIISAEERSRYGIDFEEKYGCRYLPDVTADWRDRDGGFYEINGKFYSVNRAWQYED